MKIVRFFGVALALAIGGGAVASAQGTQSVAPQSAGMSQQADVKTALAWVFVMPRRVQPVMVPPITQAPKELPLANFGQWDEAASEN